MSAVKQVAAVAMMAALLGGPVAPPDRSPGRGRRDRNPWRAFMGWLGRRRPGGQR